MLIPYAEYRQQITALIDAKKSFEIVAVPTGEMLSVCSTLENYIESQHLKCRVYTQKRVVAGAAGLLNPVYGIGALVGIAIHNAVTWNPDYEISRDLANNRIAVEWVKK